MQPPCQNVLLHITPRSCFPPPRAASHYTAPSLVSEGFIHCSTPRQVMATAARYYAGRDDLLVLVIDPRLLDAPLRYEEATHGELFPHVYGGLRSIAIIDALPLQRDAQGAFVSPAPWISGPEATATDTTL